MSSKRTAEDGDVWERRRRSRSDALSHRNYAVFAAPGMETFAQRLETLEKSRFQYLPIEWSKFQDGTDKIKMSGFNPLNKIAGEHCIFLASFHSNDVTLSQFSVLIVLLQSFVESLTIVLPYASPSPNPYPYHDPNPDPNTYPNHDCVIGTSQ